MKFIERGMNLQMQEEIHNQTTGKTYKATFYDLPSDTSFFAESMELYHGFTEGAVFRISFFRGASMFEFTGRAKEAVRIGAAYLLLIEQISGIAESNRREYDRCEMRLDVRLYGCSEDSSGNTGFKKTEENAVFSAETLDISPSGFCLVSNQLLSSEYEPHFLAEFVLNKNDQFLLPAKLMRKGDGAKSILFKYDYGFIFLYDNIPREKDRLINAIFMTKLAKLNR